MRTKLELAIQIEKIREILNNSLLNVSYSSISSCDGILELSSILDKLIIDYMKLND